MDTSIIGEIVIATFALAGTLVGSIASSKKTLWRIDQLEKKVEKHNNMMERIAVLENEDRLQWQQIEELKR